jgi:hypothetical protein
MALALVAWAGEPLSRTTLQSVEINGDLPEGDFLELELIVPEG